jgi:hypothetical protein
MATLNTISADALRGRLSFLASDALEGRDTPSHGLDIAAEYIASEFRRAGLEPVGDDGYFQNAPFVTTQRDPEQVVLTVAGSSGNIRLSGGNVRLMSRTESANTTASRVIKVPVDSANTLNSLTAEQVNGSVVCAEYPNFTQLPSADDRIKMFTAFRQFEERITALKPGMVLYLDRAGNVTGGRSFGGLRPADGPAATRRSPRGSADGPTTVAAGGESLLRWYDGLPAGTVTNAAVTFQAPAETDKPIRLRNVVGLLRGSDPVLKDTYILVTAHYDHLGATASTDGTDRIYNGANDDGSGTVSVMEIASTLAKLKPRPKRSILFMCFFGEEKGLLGSRYYGRKPLFPLEKTIAQINLEQIGRTDDSEGPRVGAANLTGFDYSDVGTFLQRAGTLTGIRLEKHPTASDSYFGRSDNQALADVGVPAHTVSVAYSFPDYHQVGDHWDKVDYANMAKVARMVAAGIVLMADSPTEPRWNASNPRASRYLQAWQARRASNSKN